MPKLGQHFLNDPQIADRIVEAADIGPGDSVVEIGPGEGVLTERLLARSAKVVAVELDGRLVDHLRKRLSDRPDLRIVHGDFLRVDLEQLPRPCAFVANLPYAVASPILQRILSQPGWTRAVLMFQKEVAERILAGLGARDYGLLTVSVAMKASAEKICEVPRSRFRPSPKVDSAVIRLDPRVEPLLPPGLPEDRFLDVVRAAFAHRRKTVLNSLAHALGAPKNRVEQALRACGLDPGIRAENISPEDFVDLCAKLSKDSG